MRAMSETTMLLDIRGLTVRYGTQGGEVRAVEGLDLSLARGETLGFVGETGAGKTTTALAVMRLVPEPAGRICGGEVIFEGEDLLKKSPRDMRSIRGSKISMIFQDPMTSLDPVKTVGEQIAEMIGLHESVSRREALAKAQAMLETVGIRAERSGDYPHQFSGGMKQRVVIAIALACNPALVIADEPTTALDVTIQAQVLDLMRKLKDRYRTSMILITHDLGVVAETCDKAAIMYAGNIVEYADKASLFARPSHPYTQGLFGSVPDIESDAESLNVISGLTPDPTDLPPGCPFHPRCPRAEGACSTQAPPKVEIEEGHFVRCFLHGSGGRAR